MSIPERVFRISKSYLNQVRDRIDAELSDAERELDADVNGVATTRPGGIDAPDEEGRSRSYRDSDPEAMMRRAEARIAAARRDLESRTGNGSSGGAGSAPPAPASVSISAAPKVSSATTPPPTPPKNTQVSAESEGDPNYHDYRVLGVPVGGDLAQVQSEYEKLSRRLDPTRLSFPEGSTEQQQAAQILTRINNAYDALRRRLDPTLQRMTHLELE